MVEYNEAYLKLSDTQINKLKTAAKNQTGVTLRININIINEKSLPREWIIINNKTNN